MTQCTRRVFLKHASTTFAASFLANKYFNSLSHTLDDTLPLPKEETPPLIKTDVVVTKTLHLFNRHTQECLKEIPFFENGQYCQRSLRELDHFFRDHRTNQVKSLDPKLYDLLYDLTQKVESSKRVDIISGYRSPASNKALCENSSGVAKNSQHVLGKAIDLFIPCVSIKKLVKAAKSLKAGGVGGYSQFVHIDTGPLRSWGIR